jgi:hypothetical protein
VLPSDVDVLLVALPQIVTRSAVNASRVLDQVLLVAEANLTSRVELMASLDALRVAGCAPQVVLVDGGTYCALRPATPGPERERTVATIPAVPLSGTVMPAPEQLSESTIEPEVAATIEPEPMLVPEPEPMPEPEPEPEPPSLPEPPLSAGEPSSPLRTVDVLDAAAREQATTTLEAALVDTVPMARSEVLAPTRAPAPAPAPEPAPAAPAPAPVPHAAAPDEDLTTELSTPRPPIPSWASEDDEEDLLRTTVQMSVFNDELDLRDED